MRVLIIDTLWRGKISTKRRERDELRLRIKQLSQEIKDMEKEFPSKGRWVTLK